MKKSKHGIFIPVKVLVAVLSMSCQHQEPNSFEREAEVSPSAKATVASEPITIELYRDTPSVLPLDTTAAPVSAADAMTLGAQKGPMAYAQSIFDDNLVVEPWRANYVGSYGVMPTRQPDNGPFWYSFQVDPDADVFNDDDTRPIYEEELFWQGDDDDDDGGL